MKKILLLALMMVLVNCVSYAEKIVLKEGSYGDTYSERASATVTKISEDSYIIEIDWGDSAYEGYDWTMTATMMENGMLIYHDCVEKDIITEDNGMTTERIINIVPDGYFVAINNGLFDWTGATEENCRKCVFEYEEY